MHNTDEEWHVAMVAAGHSPVLDKDGIDMFVYGDFDPEGSDRYCNGPACQTCGWSCCQHCQGPDSIPECTGLPVF
jgi:hypothetical protein